MVNVGHAGDEHVAVVYLDHRSKSIVLSLSGRDVLEKEARRSSIAAH